jgi:hemerythrin superfamily protein
MKEFLDHLKDDHRRLLALSEELEQALAGTLTDAARLQQLCGQIIMLLTSHGRREVETLFPALKASLPTTDRWQIAMLEIQDEAILVEAQHLLDGCADPAAMPVARFRESGARLVRWMREHVLIEEERLFPRLDGRARGSG